MEFTSQQIINLIERASGLSDIMSKKESIEELLKKFAAVEEYMRRFHSLEELTLHLKEMEDMIYMCKEYLNMEEACKYLSMSKYTLRDAVKRREIPYYTPPGRGYYFMKRELDEWVSGFRVASLKEVEDEAGQQARAEFAANNKGRRHEGQNR